MFTNNRYGLPHSLINCASTLSLPVGGSLPFTIKRTRSASETAFWACFLTAALKVSKSSGANIAAVKEINSEIKSENIKPNNTSGTEVSSPIIGTAYLAPEPGGKKFVEVGKKINKGDTIMIVEAMKTMNHVPSPIAGTIKKICVEDGQPVEYGHTIAIIE